MKVFKAANLGQWSKRGWLEIELRTGQKPGDHKNFNGNNHSNVSITMAHDGLTMTQINKLKLVLSACDFEPSKSKKHFQSV